FCLDRALSKELRGRMSSLLKSTEAKKLRGIFSPTFDSRSFDLQVPKLVHSMSRRLKELKGGEGSKVEMKEKTLVSHQFRLLDVARPLLYLWGQLSCDPDLKDSSMADAAVSALQLWGHSFHSVTMHRRENILKQTDPRFQALLLEPNRFSPKECGSLFGRSFLKQM
ncbi:Uncharacterized protein APZ42_006432, partial [Daphnia magna]